MKVGELADATGLTVRTLHHYDELGLVVPSERTYAGHRIYARADVERLYRVLALRRLGLKLDQIAQVLDGTSLEETVRAHRDQVGRSLELHRRLLDRLDLLLEQEGPLTDTIEVMTMIEQYYTPEQLEQLEQRREQLGPDGMEKAQQDWADIYATARELKEQGVEPSDPRVTALVDRSDALIEQFTGGDAGIRGSLEKLHAEQGPAKATRGMADPELTAFLGAARRERDAGQDQQ